MRIVDDDLWSQVKARPLEMRRLASSGDPKRFNQARRPKYLFSGLTKCAECGGGRAIFSGDCFHHPVQIVRPDAPFFADEDPKQASATRQRLLENYANQDAIFFPAHFTGATAGRVERDRDGQLKFRFVPDL